MGKQASSGLLGIYLGAFNNRAFNFFSSYFFMKNILNNIPVTTSQPYTNHR